MKKVLLVLSVLFSIFTYSQTTLPNFESESFNWKGGNDEFYEVKFVYGIDEKIDKEILDKVVMKMMVNSKYKLKNKLSYIPKKLIIMKVENEYNGVVECIGKNGYGVEGLSKFYWKFDLEGNVEYRFSM